MRNIYSTKLKMRVQQISKAKAKRLFEEGKDIYLHPSNMMFDNAWQSPHKVNKNDSFTCDFEYICSNYKYYNCDNERGRHIHFFVEFK